MSDYRSGGKIHRNRSGKMKVKADDSGLKGKEAADEALERSKRERKKIVLPPPERAEPKRIK